MCSNHITFVQDNSKSNKDILIRFSGLILETFILKQLYFVQPKWNSDSFFEIDRRNLMFIASQTYIIAPILTVLGSGPKQNLLLQNKSNSMIFALK